jgi:hypothetical protein
MATAAEILLEWARAEGATPELVLDSITESGDGEYLSPDEKGLRSSCWHRTTVTALAPPRPHGTRIVVTSIPSKQGNEDATFDKVALCRVVMAPLYEALVGSPLPPFGGGSERCLAFGESGTPDVNQISWSVWRVNDHEGWYFEARYSWPNSRVSPEQEFKQRVARGSFRPSTKHPGGMYLPGYKKAYFSMTAEEWAEVLEEMDTFRVQGGGK